MNISVKCFCEPYLQMSCDDYILAQFPYHRYLQNIWQLALLKKIPCPCLIPLINTAQMVKVRRMYTKPAQIRKQDL